MKERPILFSGPMISPIMEGRKTKTRMQAAYAQSRLKNTANNALVPLYEEGCKLERELAEAKAEIERAKQDRNESAMRERNKYLSQLTAHKAALNLCQMALNADIHDTFMELKFEALAALKQLKEEK